VVVVGGFALAKHEVRVGGWAKTHSRAAVAWLRVRCVKWRQEMVHRGGMVVPTR
jgi:hypothetical protein